MATLEGHWGLHGNGFDSSGNARHLTTLQNVAYGTGKYGQQCLSFADRLATRAAYGAAIDASAWLGFSIVWQCNMTTAAVADERIVNFGLLDTDGVFVYVSTGLTSLKLAFGRAGNTEYPNQVNDAFDATVRTYALTFDLGTKKWIIYREGVAFGNGALTNAPVMPNRKLTIGNKDSAGAAQGWVGLVGPVSLYQGVLTPTEVAALGVVTPAAGVVIMNDGDRYTPEGLSGKIQPRSLLWAGALASGHSGKILDASGTTVLDLTVRKAMQTLELDERFFKDEVPWQGPLYASLDSGRVLLYV